MNNKSKGALFIAAATIIYGVCPILFRLSFEEGSNAITACVLRFSLGLPLLLTILLARKTSLRLTRQELLFLLLAGVIGIAGSNLFFNYALLSITVGLTATLNFTYPILVPLTCAILFKDKMDKWKLMALVAGVAGVVAFMEPNGNLAVTGVILALGSGAAYAAYIVMVDKTSLAKMDSVKLTFYLCLIAAATSLLCAVADGSFVPGDITPKGWLISVILSWASTVLALSLFQLGVGYVGSTTAAIMSSIQPITSVVLGILVYSESITIFKAIGCGLIVTSIVLVSRSGQPSSPPLTASQRLRPATQFPR